MKLITGVCWRIATSLLLLSTQFGLEAPSRLILARDVPLHHKSSLVKSPGGGQQSPELGRNTLEDSNNSGGALPQQRPPSSGGSDSVYYDYNEMLDEDSNSSPSVTPPDVIYPNPDSLPPRKQPPPALPVDSAAAAVVLAAAEASGNTQQNAPEAAATMNNNNRVLVRPNEVVDYDLVESLDRDLKEHDLIDSIMYIYNNGPNSGSALGKEVGGNIIVIGAVVALAAQLLTICILFMKHHHHRNSRQKNVLFPVLTALLAMAFLANFLFIVGVQSSRNAVKCEIIAILLHYLHLSTTVWVFLYIYCVHEFIRNNAGPNLNLLLGLGVLMPAAYIVLNYLMATSNYEVTHYCWMSVKRGMIFNYMIPISFFIVATAVYGTLCLRLLRIKQRQQFTESIESFIEHSRSEQMLNQIRQIGPECLQQAAAPPTAALREGGEVRRVERSVSHRRLARCHSNPSSTTLKKSTAHLRAAANLTTSSINLTSTSTSIGSPTKESTDPQQQMHAPPPPCCSAMLLDQSQQNLPHCLDMMGTSKSLCGGESRYSLGSISLANLSIQSLSSENEDFEDYKSAVKFAIIFQIMFSISWFLAVIALEYPTSMMPIIYVIVLNLVNWVVLAKCQAICPPMVVSPLSAVAASESHQNSFSKKSVKSIRSTAGEHHQQEKQHQEKQQLQQQSSIPTEKMAREGRNGSLRSTCSAEKKAIAMPFDDQVVVAAVRSNSTTSSHHPKKKESVSIMDTIPLLAKSAGLRTDTKATIIDNVDSSGEGQLVENGVGDRSPTTSVTATTKSDRKLSSSHILTNGHVTTSTSHLWNSSSINGINGLDAMKHRSEFISTIST